MIGVKRLTHTKNNEKKYCKDMKCSDCGYLHGKNNDHIYVCNCCDEEHHKDSEFFHDICCREHEHVFDD